MSEWLISRDMNMTRANVVGNLLHPENWGRKCFTDLRNMSVGRLDRQDGTLAHFRYIKVLRSVQTRQ